MTDTEQCGAEVYIGDDYADNHASMHCQLQPGHEGMHREKFGHRNVVVSWEKDEREVDCPECYGGCLCDPCPEHDRSLTFEEEWERDQVWRAQYEAAPECKRCGGTGNIPWADRPRDGK